MPLAFGSPAALGNTASDPRVEAQKGLEGSDKFYFRFWKQTALRTEAAERSLDRIDGMGSDAARHEVALTRVVTPYAIDAKSRLLVMREGLSQIEGGAAAGIAGMAGMAVRLFRSTEHLLNNPVEPAEKLLAETVQTAKREGATEAEFAQYLQSLAEVGGNSKTALELLSSKATDHASAGLRMHHGTYRPAVVRLALQEVEKRGAGDAAVGALFSRRATFAALDIGERAKETIDFLTLTAVEKKLAAGPETAASFATEIMRSGNLSAMQQETLAVAALQEAAKATYPADSPVPAWLAFANDMRACLGDSSTAPQVLAAIIGGKQATLDARATVLAGLLGALKADAAGVASARSLFHAMEDLDKREGGDLAEYFNTFRAIESKMATDDALRFTILSEGIRGLTTPGNSAPYVEGGMASLGLRLVERLSDPKAQRTLAMGYFEEMERVAAGHGRKNLAQFLHAAADTMRVRLADDRQYGAFFSACMKSLQKEPTDAAGYTVMVDRLLGSQGYALDKLHLAENLLSALRGLLAAHGDPTGAERVRFLEAVLAHEMYDPKAQAEAISAGLQYLAKPPKVTGNPVAHFVQHVNQHFRVVRGRHLYVDNIKVALDGTAAIRAAATDQDTTDACSLIEKMAEIPAADEQYRAAPLNAGIAWLASKQNVKGDAYVALGGTMMASTSYQNQRAAMAEALAEGLRVRSQRAGAFDREAQSRFLLQLADMTFASHEDRSNALLKGIELAANSSASQEDGLARVALAAMGGARYPLDQIHIGQAALAEARAQVEQGGNRGRTALLKTYERAAAIENYEDKYRAAVITSALKSVAARPLPEPGEVAAVGLDMINNAYYFSSAQDVAEAVMSGLEAIAATENDTVFVPALVADMRNRVSLAKTQKEQTDALRQGLKEISKLKGDEFRKALVQALQKQNPANAPKIEEGEDFVVIGGIKVPKK